MRPCDSVTGTRWTRWTPPSYLNHAQTPSGSLPGAVTVTVTSLKPPRSDSVDDRTSTFQPRRSA